MSFLNDIHWFFAPRSLRNLRVVLCDFGNRTSANSTPVPFRSESISLSETDWMRVRKSVYVILVWIRGRGSRCNLWNSRW